MASNENARRNGDPWLVAKIITGILIGGLVLYSIIRWREAKALEATAAELREWTAKMEAESAIEQEEALKDLWVNPPRSSPAKRKADFAPIPLAADERCIGRQRFRKLPNGWEEIGSC